MHPTDESNIAINFALSGNWKEAIQSNLLILKKDQNDIDALNRLGRAYFETGQKSKAEETYKKVLKLDKFNPIATRSLQMLKTSRVVHQTQPTPHPMTQTMFLEESGVTKTISPIRLGDSKVIARLHPGDPIIVAVRQHTVAFVTSHNEYLGRLSDDLSLRLRTFIKAGNQYQAWIKSVEPLKIFVRETHRAPKYASTPSFPSTEKLSYAAFTPPELIHEEKPDVSATEEQENSPSSGFDEEYSSERSTT